MDIHIILVGVITVAAIALFFWGKFRIDVVAVCILVALFSLNLITPEQALSGLASKATVTIAAMYVISAGLMRTGIVDWAARKLDGIAGQTQLRLMLIISLTAAFLSAFIINTAIVAIFIPVAIVLSRSRKITPSKILIPLSFASQFGGVCTLVGTSTNLIVNSYAINNGLQPFGFFEFFPLGIAMVGAGMVYLAALGKWLLPERKGETEQVDRYRLVDYFAELEGNKDSPFIGKYWDEIEFTADEKINLANFYRESKNVSRPRRTRIRENDILLVQGSIEQIVAMESKYNLSIQKNKSIKDSDLSLANMELVEVLIPPDSNLINRSFRDTDFFTRHHLNILAIQRRGQILKERLLDAKLTEYDTLLIQGQKDLITHIMNSPNVIVTNEMTDLYLNKRRAVIALIIILAVVLLTTFNVMEVMLAAIAGAAAMVVTQCLTIEEAYKSIDWKIIFLLIGVIPLGIALETSGITMWLADKVLIPLASHGPVVVLAALYLVTAVLTEAMSNNAAAAILAPVAFTTAVALDIDPRPLLVAITFAASTSFATPIGYKTNTMIFSPGGYRFTDFTKIGVPLNLVFWGIAVVLIPIIWPF